jgi:uncharacterized protein (TIGR02646 family)
MKNICKSFEPIELKDYKERFSSQFRRWNDLKKKKKTLRAIRHTLEKDQKGLCAYCEIELSENNRSVEHFIPCNQSTKENNYDLDWSNLLAVCFPPGCLLENDSSQIEDLNKFPCCGKKKDDFVPDNHFLNPLKLITLRLFTISLNGEIRPDIKNCINHKIAIEDAQFTIDQLGLNVARLKRLRVRAIQDVIKTRERFRQDFGEEEISEIELEIETAKWYFGDGTESWPRFFTTIRSILGEGAEQHLKEISYSG